MTTTEKEPFPHVTADPKSEPLLPVQSVQVDETDDDPDAIFFNAAAEIDTQPLPRRSMIRRWQDVLQVLLCSSLLVGSMVGMVWQVITYPKTLIILYTIEKPASLTATLDLPTRTLAPITLTRSLTMPTTGHGHLDARAATGGVTLYNGLFTAQAVPGGTVFTGQDGVQVTTTAAVTLPAANPTANPPQFVGEATVPAHALLPGAAGNIAAGDINATVVNGVSVKNTSPFHNGRDARDFHAVAHTDIDSLTVQITYTLAQTFHTSFGVRPGEQAQPTHCHTTTTANHQEGDEALTVTLTGSETCSAIAYSQSQLQAMATQTFIAQTRPGTHYTLVGSLISLIVNVTPLTVHLTGSWVYVFTREYQQSLAEHIAGYTPQQARAYLLKTGVISQANVPGTLPASMYIQFVVLEG